MVNYFCDLHRHCCLYPDCNQLAIGRPLTCLISRRSHWFDVAVADFNRRRVAATLRNVILFAYKQLMFVLSDGCCSYETGTCHHRHLPLPREP
jgi:hypothetical protein